MECQRVSRLPEGDDWWYEIKHDGYRVIAVVSGADVVLNSFSGLDYTERFPAVAFALKQMRLGAAVFHGELVALDAKGRSNFQELQNYRNTKLTIVYYVFDVLDLEGRDLTKLRQEERRKRLEELSARFRDPVRINPAFHTDLQSFIAQVKKLGFEGVVAKRRSTPYLTGKVSDGWQKHRFGREDEFVIGGYIPGPGGFSELLIGHYREKDLHFIKRLITGFVPYTRAEVFDAIKGLKTKKCPFVNLPEPKRSKHALTAERMKECVWIRPERQCEVEFVEWTRGGHMRHPKFRRLVG